MRECGRKNIKDGMGLRCSITVKAPMHSVWKILTDVQGYPGLYPVAENIQLKSLDGDKCLNPVEAGAKWLITGKKYGLNWKIPIYTTVVDDGVDSDEKVLAIATTLSHVMGTARTVLTYISTNQCQLTMSYHMIPDNVFGKLIFWVAWNRMVKLMDYAMFDDLRIIKDVAEAQSSSSRSRTTTTTRTEETTLAETILKRRENTNGHIPP